MTNYSAFGVQLSGRNLTNSMVNDSYRYGMNGMEQDDEIKGDGNSYDFGARMLDPRLGRWLTIDSKFKKYAGINPYNFVLNCPIIMKDPNGEDGIITVDSENHTVTLSTTVYLYGDVGPDPNATAAAYTQSFKDICNVRQVEDQNDPSIIWTVKIEVSYVYDATIAAAMDKGENVDIPKGSNTLKLTNTTSIHGATPLGGSDGHAGSSNHEVFHETGHMLGLEDRYIGVGIAEYSGDIMSNLSSGLNWGGVIGQALHIRGFHFVDILDYALSFPTTETENGKVFDGEEKLVEKSAEWIDYTDESGVTDRKRKVTYEKIINALNIDGKALRVFDVIKKDLNKEKRVKDG